MIFNKLNVVLATVMTFGLAANALATDSSDNCSIGCGTPPASSGLSLNITGAAATGGNVGSIFQGNSGSNEVYKFGDTSTLIESSLGGFCSGGDCTDTQLKMNLMATEGGNALTKSGSDTSAEDTGAQNSGVFTSGVNGGIKFGGNTSQFGSQGASGFANSVMTNATGGNVNTMLETYGSGQTVSTLGTSGNACPTCVDLTGGTTANAASGMNFMSNAAGGHSGQLIGITGSALSESASNMSNMFK